MFFIESKINAFNMLEVGRENLIPGKEYYLRCFCPSCVSANESYIMISKFEKLEKPESTHTNPDFKWVCVTNFRKPEEINDRTSGRCLRLDCRWQFYEIPVR